MPCEIPISTFETRLRISNIESRVSRRERELPSLCLILLFYRGLRNEIENFSHFILRFEIEKMFRPFSSPSSCRPASTGICSFTHIWGGPMLLFDWLRALNQTCFLNFRQYVGLLMLDKRKALIATKPTPSHHPIQLHLLHMLHFSNARLNVFFVTIP